ncbi:MAG: CCDC90 family protein [Magnetococcus sp. THC-1_WYH]
MSAAVPFDTLAFARELESAGVPSVQAEAQAKALSGVLQKVEESRLQDVATKGDILRLEGAFKGDILRLERELKELELRMVIKTGAMILGGIGLLFGLMRAWPLPVQYVPPLVAQEKYISAPSVPVPPQNLIRP